MEFLLLPPLQPQRGRGHSVGAVAAPEWVGEWGQAVGPVRQVALPVGGQWLEPPPETGSGWAGDGGGFVNNGRLEPESLWAERVCWLQRFPG